MKKLFMVLMLGVTLFSCTNAVKKQVTVCVQANLLSGAVCEVTRPAPVSAPDPVRETREPVMLLRILTEL